MRPLIFHESDAYISTSFQRCGTWCWLENSEKPNVMSFSRKSPRMLPVVPPPQPFRPPEPQNADCSYEPKPPTSSFFLFVLTTAPPLSTRFPTTSEHSSLKTYT